MNPHFIKNYLVPLSIFLFVSFLYSVNDLLAKALSLLVELDIQLFQQILSSSVYLVLTWIIARFIRLDIIHGLLEERFQREIPRLMGDIAGFLVFCAGILFILTTVLKQDITALLATGGIGIMVLGISLQDLISSIFSGLTLNMENPFKIGDTLKMDFAESDKEVIGTVKEINWRSTHLIGPEGDLIVVPNNQVANAILVNHSQPTVNVRSKVSLEIDATTSIDSAERILLAATLDAPKVLPTPPPQVYVEVLSEQTICCHVHFWHAEFQEQDQVNNSVTRSLLARLQDAGIMHPSDHSTDRINLINQIDLFRPFPPEWKKMISEAMEPITFPAGVTIVGMGEEDQSLYLIAEGLCQYVASDFRAQPPKIHRLIATKHFGAMSLCVGEPQRGTVTSKTDVLLYRITPHILFPLLRNHQEMLPAMCSILARSYLQEIDPDRADRRIFESQDRLIQVLKGQLFLKCALAARASSEKNN
ncbi:mechanosensitive ion channel domain-containing protein [Magnetococcales bacterium HHB-1]